MNGQKSRIIKKADYLRFIKQFATVPGLDYFLAECEENRKTLYMRCLACCNGFSFLESDGKPTPYLNLRMCEDCIRERNEKAEVKKISKSFCVGINSNNEIMIYKATGVTCYDFDDENERDLLVEEIEKHVKPFNKLIHCDLLFYDNLYTGRDVITYNIN